MNSTLEMSATPRVARVAVVGCGHWGTNLVRNFAALGALAAVCDVDPGRRDAAAELGGAASETLDEVLRDPVIEGIVLATPAATHASLAKRALDAGKHVFVEKPLALSVEDACQVCLAADRAGRILMVGHLLNYHPAFNTLASLVREGGLGRLQYLSSNRLNFGRFRREEDILWSFAPHDISMILRLVGAEPDAVHAVASTHLHKTIADVTTTHLSFPGGEGAHIHVSWLYPIKEQRLVVVGDRGMAVFDDGQRWESKLVVFRHHVEWREGMPFPAKAEAEAVHIEPGEPLTLECEHFLQCIATGTTPDTDGHEGLRVLRVLERAQATLRPPSEIPSRNVDSVHPTATIDGDVQIGSGTRVWHYVHVLSGSRIGRDCVLGQNVMVGPNVRIGDGCRIQNNVSVFEGVTLEKQVFCGPSVVFTNVRIPRAGIDRGREFEPTLVESGATIGANSTIVCGNKIGAYSMIAAGAVVTRDVPPHALMVGVPARRVGWVSHAGERLGEDLVCPRTGRRYLLKNDTLTADE